MMNTRFVYIIINIVLVTLCKRKKSKSFPSHLILDSKNDANISSKVAGNDV